MSLKRFYIFTGKGGVGKTALSLAFCSHLTENKQNCLYIYFQNNKIQAKNTNTADKQLEQMAMDLGFKTLGLDLMACSQEYIANKLKSENIAKWIIKTPFFQSLVNMIPGLSYVIYMGKILEMLVKDPTLTAVLDSPSSGHALTMLESTQNFNSIFKDGIIHEDTNLMLKELQTQDFFKLNIIALPTLLALHEAIELKTSIKNLANYDLEIFCNNCLNQFEQYELPDFLINKIKNENKALEEFEHLAQQEVPYNMGETPLQVIKELVPSMENLV
ncbi:MAG: hypothetical protein HON90_01135 [Halobacteriovoraceae bacterium]|jgi:anion-transporting  ArsA/GET3 family ATPase|nr:hypothetical protein [Halobacteriovoraceae bacterium]